MIGVKNIHPLLATAMMSGFATLYELQTVYGTEDLWDLLEVHTVKIYNHNQQASTSK